MTTSDPKAPSALVKIMNSGWATAGTVLAVPLTGAAVATGGWGWAVAAVGSVALGAGAATFRAKHPEPLPGPGNDTSPKPLRPHGREARPIHTYYFLSETRIAMLHAQLFHGEVGTVLREIVKNSSGGAEAGIDVPPVKAVTKYARDIARKYAEETRPTNETLTGEVLGELRARGLLHEPDSDLERVARLVAQPDADSQFLKFYMAGPEFRQAIPGQPQSQQHQQATDHAVEVETHDLKITMHISSRGMLEDFAELEHKENAAVIGALRRLDADSKTATVRVIVVY